MSRSIGRSLLAVPIIVLIASARVTGALAGAVDGT